MEEADDDDPANIQDFDEPLSLSDLQKAHADRTIRFKAMPSDEQIEPFRPQRRSRSFTNFNHNINSAHASNNE